MYHNAYVLDENEVWRYASNNEPVPQAYTMVDPQGNIYMDAPELLAHQMLDRHAIAQLLGIKYDSVQKLIDRNDLPAYQVHVAGSPLWARPIIEHWRAQRPGKGANLRKSA